MVQRILKDANGNIWKNEAGKIILDRPFDEKLIERGLIGEFDADNVENVGGYCKTMYNYVIGGANFVQNTASLQFKLTPNYKNGKNALLMYNNYNHMAASFSLSLNHTLFLVVQNKGNFNQLSFGGNSNNADNGLGFYSSYVGVKQATGVFYYNNVYQTTSYKSTILNKFYILACQAPYATTNFLQLGLQTTASTGHYVLACCLYNRTLSAQEISYNMRAYGTRYNIPMEA